MASAFAKASAWETEIFIVLNKTNFSLAISNHSSLSLMREIDKKHIENLFGFGGQLGG